ncbi:MAG: fumarylacetoacetate hydrolase family protein [Candidatus Dormibacteria bacterium]
MLATRPSKIVCVGRNYAAHAAELGHDIPTQPLIFLKAPSSLISDGDDVEYPPLSARVDHEAELAVIIGKRCRNVSEADALSVISGYTCANDVTARDLQDIDGQWSRAKSFDTFCPIGPRVVTELDPFKVRVIARVNGVVRQDASTTDMIFPLPRLIAHITAFMTLEEGDLLLTGTPPGVGPVQRGDLMEVEVEGIGILRNRVV